MRRLSLLAVGIILFGAAACRKKQPVQYIEEGSAQLATAVNMADPRTSVQLLRGFHDVENNSWRWTMGKFSVALRPPKETAAVRVYAEFVLPDVSIQKLGAITITASVDGKPVGAQTYRAAGNHRFEQPVPAEVLKQDAVNVDFSLDKYFEAGAVEQRELGVIVSAVGFEPVKAADKPAQTPPATK